MNAVKVAANRLQTLGAKFESDELSFQPTNAGVWLQILGNDPLRTAIIMQAADTSNFIVSVKGPTGPGFGFLLTVGQRPFELLWKDVGVLVTRPWFAKMAVMSGTLIVQYTRYHEDW